MKRASTILTISLLLTNLLLDAGGKRPNSLWSRMTKAAITAVALLSSPAKSSQEEQSLRLDDDTDCHYIAMTSPCFNPKGKVVLIDHPLLNVPYVQNELNKAYFAGQFSQLYPCDNPLNINITTKPCDLTCTNTKGKLTCSITAYKTYRHTTADALYRSPLT